VAKLGAQMRDTKAPQSMEPRRGAGKADARRRKSQKPREELGGGENKREERRELEAYIGAEYTYRMPPDVAVRPAAVHLRSAVLCFSSRLFESTEQVHVLLYIEYRVLTRRVVHWWYNVTSRIGISKFPSNVARHGAERGISRYNRRGKYSKKFTRFIYFLLAMIRHAFYPDCIFPEVVVLIAKAKRRLL